MKNILIVDNNALFQDFTSNALCGMTATFYKTDSGVNAIKTIHSKNIDLVISELVLPDIDGFNLCKLIKNDLQNQNIPIIILSSIKKERDIIKCFSLGVEDYITKPVNPEILKAKVKIILKNYSNSNQKKSTTLRIHNLEMDADKYQIFLNNKYIKLTKLEFQTLYLLASTPGKVFSRDQILDSMKGSFSNTLDRSVDSLIVRLRKKLQTNDLIETVWGLGYRFKE